MLVDICTNKVLSVVNWYFAVLPPPSGNETIMYYMSRNGSDTSYCGRSVDSACSSMLHVLKLYYAEPPTIGLKIMTDKSLVIDKRLMVSLLIVFCSQQSSFPIKILCIQLMPIIWISESV